MLKWTSFAAFVLFLTTAAAGLSVALQQRDLRIEEKARADEQIDNLHQAVAVRDQALEAWGRVAQEQTLRVEAAERAAAAARQEMQRRTARALTAPVPADCHEAAKWMAVWGRERGQAWAE
jgi:hypothetical protein